LKKPRILLLDEATSALDKVNEGIVQTAIDSYRKKYPITIIVIAHRLSTIRDADKIVVLVDGKMTEVGNHEHLMTEYPDGTYAEFCKKQASQEQDSGNPTTAEREKENEVVSPGKTADKADDEGALTEEVKAMLAKADEQDKIYDAAVAE